MRVTIFNLITPLKRCSPFNKLNRTFLPSLRQLLTSEGDAVEGAGGGKWRRRQESILCPWESNARMLTVATDEGRVTLLVRCGLVACLWWWWWGGWRREVPIYSADYIVVGCSVIYRAIAEFIFIYLSLWLLLSMYLSPSIYLPKNISFRHYCKLHINLSIYLYSTIYLSIYLLPSINLR